MKKPKHKPRKNIITSGWFSCPMCRYSISSLVYKQLKREKNFRTVPCYYGCKGLLKNYKKHV